MMKKITTTLVKEGKYIKFTNANGKLQSANANFPDLPEEAFGKELTAFQEGPKLVKVIWENEKYTPLVQNQAKQQEEENNQPGNITNKNQPIQNEGVQHAEDINNQEPQYSYRGHARAPYNFVPLPRIAKPVLLPETNKERLQAQDHYLPGLLSGSISFKLKALTHAFFGGQHEATKKTFILNGKTVIPSATQRGLLRNAVAIVSHGKFGPVDEQRRFYYRSQTGTHAEAGILKYTNGVYVLFPCTFREIRNKSNHQLNELEKYGPCDALNRYGRWKDGENIIIKPKSANQKTWCINPPNNEEKIVLSEQDCETFNVDFELRKASWGRATEQNRFPEYMDLLELAKKLEEGVPVFYITEETTNGKRIFMGNTKGFRLPFSQSLGDLIPQNFRVNAANGLDFAEGLFGTLDGPKGAALRGRIRVENAYGPVENDLEQLRNLGILLSPKPSAVQMYLEQKHGVRTPNTELSKYNANTSKLRGRKCYHHRIFEGSGRQPDYFMPDSNNIQPNLNRIHTIKPGSRFQSKIHFMNLLPEELGALLFVLDLPKGYAHKLGMGKPLGLGSFSIQDVKLNIWKTDTLYEKVFSENGELAISEAEDQTSLVQEYKKNFEDYILTELDSQNQNLWETDMMQHYAAMLDTEGKNSNEWLKETEYMKLPVPANTDEKRAQQRLWTDKVVLPHALYVKNPGTDPNPNPYA